MSTHAVLGRCRSSDHAWLVHIGTGPSCRRVASLLAKTEHREFNYTNFPMLPTDSRDALEAAARQYVRSRGEQRKFKGRIPEVAEWLIGNAEYSVESAEAPVAERIQA